MSYIAASYWEEPPETRAAMVRLADEQCLHCGRTLHRQPFIAWDVAHVRSLNGRRTIGLHPTCAYRMSIGLLNDLATEHDP